MDNPFSCAVTKDIIDSAPNLKYIGVLSTAFGKVDIEYAKSKDIVVTNIPGYSTESVSEFVFGVILNHVRDLERGIKTSRDGIYSETGFSATEIRGKTFGIIGMGSIGQRVAELALAFGANVIYWSRNRKDELEGRGVKYEDVDSVISKSDILSLHLSQTPETENFLNAERIENMKKGAIVVNTSPMELVDLDGLEKRLVTGDITFILDHSDEMKKDDIERISKYDNCIVYPPIGFVSEEATIAKQEIFVGNIENFLKGEPTNVVN